MIQAEEISKLVDRSTTGTPRIFALHIIPNIMREGSIQGMIMGQSFAHIWLRYLIPLGAFGTKKSCPNDPLWENGIPIPQNRYFFILTI